MKKYLLYTKRAHYRGIGKKLLEIDRIKIDPYQINQSAVKNESFLLTLKSIFVYIKCSLAKSSTEPRNSNDLHMANSTPQACFFIRSTHTPKERQKRLSMVMCSEKGSPFAVFHMSQFSSPLYITAQM